MKEFDQATVGKIIAVSQSLSFYIIRYDNGTDPACWRKIYRDGSWKEATEDESALWIALLEKHGNISEGTIRAYERAGLK